MGTAIEDGWTDGSTNESGLELASFTDAEAAGVLQTSWEDTDDNFNVGAADKTAGASSENFSSNVKISTVSVGNFSDSAITVDAIVRMRIIRDLELAKRMRASVKTTKSNRRVRSAK